MGADISRVFVVDVESTCWSTKEEQGTKPNELIEIGICVYHPLSGIIGDVASYVVRPRFTEVSAFCTELTGWTQTDVDGGLDIAEALSRIGKDYQITKDNIWFSCGEYDRHKLSGRGRGSVFDLYNIQRNNPFDLMRSHVNIKTLFAMKHRLRREVGMPSMIKMIGETLEGRHHNGADDAANIAKIVRHLLS